MARMIDLPSDVHLIQLNAFRDERGDWVRIFDADEVKEISGFSQISLSFNPNIATLRGLHYQNGTSGEFKLVHCLEGAIFDVVVDVRRESENYLSWHGRVLSSSDPSVLIIPPGYAHGFISLEPNTKLLYAMDKPFKEQEYKVIRWSDPKVSISWPVTPKFLSSKDRNAEFI
jgi:dTDP-4-dehydrorhamnose 3,5-epimerase